MIFDAKYYKNTFVNAYMNNFDKRVRTSHLNQVRGYLLDSEFKGDKCGALLYPTVTDSSNIVYPLQDTPIIVKTINLNTDWGDIHNDLLDFIDRIENVQGQIQVNRS